LKKCCRTETKGFEIYKNQAQTPEKSPNKISSLKIRLEVFLKRKKQQNSGSNTSIRYT
jgi:hypothetical protein